MPNRLAASTSPYLLQHADNPVDWQEWSDEAFAEARRRDVPIFLSVGYSACHWCHVMAHESFEDDEVAALINERFVAIKLDREERPDIDSVYMQATIALTGSGGWPMSVFLDHDGQPFYAGTYFPKMARGGMPGFMDVLAALSQTWRERRDDVERVAGRVVEALQQRATAELGDLPTAAVLSAAVASLQSDFDEARGGFGPAPKFPPSMVLEFLLREAARTGDALALHMAERTLEAMARGGMYDQLGGGFARYSVDPSWTVPHFEKMLYDNALLLRAYLHWHRLTGSELALRIVRETALFMLDELRTPEGGFASALDADTDGVEGRFYAWSPQEVVEVLGEADGAWAVALLHVTREGTFEHGSSTLQLLSDPDDLERWARVRARLHAHRDATRTRPGRDDKIVAAWNGLAIAALAEAGALLGEDAWVEAAVAAGDLLLAVHLGPLGDDRLCRTSRDGRPGGNAGVLDDYGSVAEGFLALFQVTGDDSWLALAGVLLDVAIGHFRDEQGGFFDTADDAAPLVQRPQSPSDNAEPSGWFAVANACLSYAALTGVTDYRDIAERALGVVPGLARRSPRACGWGLAAAAALVDGPLEIAVIGVLDAPDTRALRAVALASTAPGAVVAVGTEGSDVPLLRDRTLIDGQAAAYACRGFTCDLPTTSAHGLAAQVRARLGE
ncbi:MAG: thioredoxin domain-containing protein [Candidatus Nanopelagicales bacterium]|nr:thioredoxin domain-containing protein [Candidatus Nanopelagicales bacterium]